MNEFFATRAEAVAYIGNRAAQITASSWEAFQFADQWAHLVSEETIRPETEWETTIYVVDRLSLSSAMTQHHKQKQH